jgi:hypothetical protein
MTLALFHYSGGGGFLFLGLFGLVLLYLLAVLPYRRNQVGFQRSEYEVDLDCDTLVCPRFRTDYLSCHEKSI